MKLLITGAASGIGLALARLAHSRGDDLLLVDRDGSKLGEVAASLPGSVVLAGDIADESAWDSWAPGLNGLDAAALNAGISDAAPIEQLAFDSWRSVLRVNLDGLFLSLRAALRAMRGPGAICVTASASGIKPAAGTAAYGASKAAAIQLAKVAALEAAPRNIRVNAIAPGGVDTPIWDGPHMADLVASQGSRDAAIAAIGSASPLGRFATADEIAQQVAFLLSDATANVTGSVLTSDSGYSL